MVLAWTVERWLDAAEWKGQHWQHDTGSVCGSCLHRCRLSSSVTLSCLGCDQSWETSIHVHHLQFTSAEVKNCLNILWRLLLSCRTSIWHVCAISRWALHGIIRDNGSCRCIFLHIFNVFWIVEHVVLSQNDCHNALPQGFVFKEGRCSLVL